MVISHKDRSMKTAWDVKTYIAVNRMCIEHKRGAIGLSMLQLGYVKENQRTNRELTILTVIPPWVERISIVTRLFFLEEWVSPLVFWIKVTSALTWPCVDSSLRFLRVSSVSPKESGGRRKGGMRRDGSMIKVSFTELCWRMIETKFTVFTTDVLALDEGCKDA